MEPVRRGNTSPSAGGAYYPGSFIAAQPNRIRLQGQTTADQSVDQPAKNSGWTCRRRPLQCAASDIYPYLRRRIALHDTRRAPYPDTTRDSLHFDDATFTARRHHRPQNRRPPALGAFARRRRKPRCGQCRRTACNGHCCGSPATPPAPAASSRSCVSSPLLCKFCTCPTGKPCPTTRSRRIRTSFPSD